MLIQIIHFILLDLLILFYLLFCLFQAFFVFFFFFFFSSRRRHTRSLRDWSSDVCSSDLLRLREHLVDTLPEPLEAVCGNRLRQAGPHDQHVVVPGGHPLEPLAPDLPERSEERRVGKECRSRGARDQEKKKKKERYE